MTVLFLIFFWIRSVQNGSNLIKHDQTGFLHQPKNVTIKSCHIYIKDKNDCFIFDFFLIRSAQNGSNLIKLDFSPIKKCYYRKLSHLQKG